MRSLLFLLIASLAGAACGDNERGPTPPEVGPEGELVFTSRPDLAIADRGTVADVITIAESGFVGALEIDLDIEHPRVFELQLTLEHEPSGVRFRLVTSPASVSRDIKLRLADDAPLDVQDDVLFAEEDDPAYDQPEYRPYEPLRFAAGLPLAGDWTLLVRDIRADSTGVLRSWALRVVRSEEPPPAEVVMARPRFLPQRLARGITTDQPLRYRGLPGTGAVTLSVTGSRPVTGAFAVVDDTSAIKTGVVSYRGDELGETTLTFTASDGAVSDAFETTAELVDLRARGLALMSQLSPAQLGYPGSGGNDCWGWTDPEDGSEYAIVGLSGGLAFVDISEPANPVLVGTLDTHTTPSGWRDVKVYADHAFVVSEAESHGLQVFDLTDLRGLDGAPPIELSESAHFAGFGSAHNIAIDAESGYAFIVGATQDGFSDQCNGGLYMLDIRDPDLVTFAGCFAGGPAAVAEPGVRYPEAVYTHDAQCAVYRGPDAGYAGRQLCFTADSVDDETNQSFFAIADVTDKGDVAQVARVDYPDFGFAHQGWLSADHRYFFLNDEYDELSLQSATRTMVFDLVDLERPVLLGVYENPSAAIGHNAYVVGGLLYMANYTSGLRVVDLNPDEDGVITIAGMQEVQYFDTFVEDDPLGDGLGSADFGGAWSTYPYFASGSIVISDMEHGLFVVK